MALTSILHKTLSRSTINVILGMINGALFIKDIEDIQVFGVNMSFISLSEVNMFYIP